MCDGHCLLRQCEAKRGKRERRGGAAQVSQDALAHRRGDSSTAAGGTPAPGPCTAVPPATRYPVLLDRARLGPQPGYRQGSLPGACRATRSLFLEPDRHRNRPPFRLQSQPAGPLLTLYCKPCHVLPAFYRRPLLCRLHPASSVMSSDTSFAALSALPLLLRMERWRESGREGGEGGERVGGREGEELTLRYRYPSSSSVRAYVSQTLRGARVVVGTQGTRRGPVPLSTEVGRAGGDEARGEGR